MDKEENISLPMDWYNLLKSEIESAYFRKLQKFLQKERKKNLIYPSENKVFEAFKLTPLHKVKVIIIGQDPYHGENQAHGLCFSVPHGVKIPPSLQNIFKELNTDLGIPLPTHGNLESWARQGVLLLNTIFTVRANKPGSHQMKGWEKFSDAVIKKLSNCKLNLVFILWGNFAKEKESLIDMSKHYILTAAHPSPFSANNGFFGCRHFSKTNKILHKNKNQEINWAF